MPDFKSAFAAQLLKSGLMHTQVVTGGKALYKQCTKLHFKTWYAGSLAISKQAAKKEQLRLVTEAEATCKAAQAQLRWALPGQPAAAGGAAADTRAGLAAELKVLSDNFAGLRKLVENQEVSRHRIVYKLP